VATSRDGGATWEVLRFDQILIEPICQASFLRYSVKDDSSDDRLLFSNPASTSKRHRLTFRLSNDEGKTWPVAKLLHEGPSAYSCLTVLPDGLIGCLYEGGENHSYEKIIFARFSLESSSKKKDVDLPVIKEITAIKPPRTSRLPGFRRTKPTVIENQDALTETFGDTAAKTIIEQVDLDQQVLVFFQWAGSGQDKLSYAVENQGDEVKVVFKFRAGLTRDLRPHSHLYAIRIGVDWEITKQPPRTKRLPWR